MNKDAMQGLLDKAGCEVELDEFSFDKTLKDIGLDSLDLYNLMLEIQIEYDKEIDDQEYEKLKTLNDIIFCVSN